MQIKCSGCRSGKGAINSKEIVTYNVSDNSSFNKFVFLKFVCCVQFLPMLTHVNFSSNFFGNSPVFDL